MGSTKPSPDLSSPLGLASVSTELGADFSRDSIKIKLHWNSIKYFDKSKAFSVFFRGFISSWWDDWALWCEEGRLANIYIISLVSHFIQYEWVDIYEREGLVSLAPDVALFNLGIILIVSTAAVAAWEDRRGWQRHCVRPRHRICWYTFIIEFH